MAIIYNVGETVNFILDFSNTNAYLRGHAYVTLNSQNQAARTSTLSVQLYLYKTSSTPTEDTTFRGTISFGGTSESYSTRLASLATSEQLVYSGYFTVQHNSDGSYSGSFSASCTYGSRPTSTDSETITLPTIGVNSSFTLSPSGTLYTGQTTLNVNISSPDNSWTYTMKMRNSNGTTMDLFTRIYNTSWTGVLPSSAAALLPSSNTGTIYFDLISYTSGGSELGTSTVYRTVTVGTSGGPVISNIQTQAVDASGNLVSYGFIAGVSYLKVTFNVTDTTGSTIRSVKSTIDNYEVSAVLTGTSGVLLTQHPIGSSGTVTITLVGMNARGGTGTGITTITVQDYYMPRIEVLSAVRSNSEGDTVPQGTYAKIEYRFDVSIIQDLNSYEYTIAYKKHNETTWTNLKYLTDQTTPVVELSEVYPGFDTESTYDIRLQVIDTLTGDNGRASKMVTMGVDQVIIDLKYDGSGIGFGKTSEDSGIADFGWFVRFTGGIFPVALQNGSSINDLKIPGFYYGDTSGMTVTGLPSAVSGNYGLSIFPTGVSSVLQLLISESVGSTPNMYARTISTSGQLSSWVKISVTSV